MPADDEFDSVSGHAADASMRRYYAARAFEYETLYERPERQAELALIQRKLRACLQARRVLDIACGTGYWTAHYAPMAREVVGVDINQPVLDVARQKNLPRTRFEQADCYALSSTLGQFDAAFAGFWWSHIPKSELGRFTLALHRRLTPGARVIFLDNRYVAGSSTPIAQFDDQGNSWQERALANGTRYRIRKNFPRYEELFSLLSPYATATHWWQLNYYWWFEYVLN